MARLHRLRTQDPAVPGKPPSNTADSEASIEWRIILDKVQEVRLDNGLVALTLPTPGKGSVVCDIYYASGSAADPPGRTGLSHFLEHMVFNGTRNVPKGTLDRLMLRLAGQHNAETGADFCRFWSHVPRPATDLALALEADRMQGALLDPDDFHRERQVILEEEARYREQPFEALMTRLMAEIFEGHPYAHPAIGTPEDLDRITIDDLRTHYVQIFRPANALLVIAGDVTPREAIRLAKKRFGRLQNHISEPLPLILPPGVDRFDGRLIEFGSSELVPRGAMIWPAPGPFDISSRAWGVAASILGVGRSSRLWRILVDERQIAAHVSVNLSEERLGGYLLIELELHPGQDPREAESTVLEILDQLAVEGPTAEEIARVAAARSASGCWARQQTALLATAIGTWRLFSDLESLGEAWRQDDFVTAEDVVNVAAQMRKNNCIRGWTLPNAESDVPASPIRPQSKPDFAWNPGHIEPEAKLTGDLESLARKAIHQPVRIGRKPAPKLIRSDTGAEILVEPARGQGICAIELRWRGGSLEESIPGLANLTARICEESPISPDSVGISEFLESMGASIDSGPSGFNIQGRANDLELILETLLSSIAQMSPSASILRSMARRVRTELEADSDDPAFLAERMLREMALEGLPGSSDSRGSADSIKSIKVANVKSHIFDWFRPANMILGVTGDFQASPMIRKVDRTIEKAFANARSRSGPTPPLILPTLFEGPMPPARLRSMRSPGTQTHIVMGHRTIARPHPDWIALQVLEIVLGSGPGLTDLLSRRLREELGLVYGVGMTMTDGAWTNPGHMRVAFSCDPSDADRAQNEAIRILTEAAMGNLAEEDCLQARDHLANSWFMNYESADERLSSRLDAELEDWDLGLPPRWSRQCSTLTADEIRTAARIHIRPNSLQIVRYGP
jgi:zinc protease